jgi:hypothetical protein
LVTPFQRSPFKEAVSDCETIAFPSDPRRGCKCFRVDQGKLYEWSGAEWRQIDLPKGKLWFSPAMKKLCIWTGARWRVHGEVENAGRREGG